jgi:hypothetical protein
MIVAGIIYFSRLPPTESLEVLERIGANQTKTTVTVILIHSIIKGQDFDRATLLDVA